MDTLSLVLVNRGSFSGKGDLVGAGGERVDDLVEVIFAEKAIQCFP
jgi:hypothetical protein